jgi:uncharacterized protein YndB with AHSA1/START domain
VTNDTDTIEREIFVNAPPEAVFRYLVEAEFMARWIGVSHELEPRPGGRFRVEISSGNIASGCYTEVAPHRRVAFTWGWESHDGSLAALPPGKSLVEIDLQAKDGGTLLRLRHSRLPTELGQIHGKRWSFYLGQLQSCASR